MTPLAVKSTVAPCCLCSRLCSRPASGDYGSPACRWLWLLTSQRRRDISHCLFHPHLQSLKTQFDKWALSSCERAGTKGHLWNAPSQGCFSARWYCSVRSWSRNANSQGAFPLARAWVLCERVLRIIKSHSCLTSECLRFSHILPVDITSLYVITSCLLERVQITMRTAIN